MTTPPSLHGALSSLQTSTALLTSTLATLDAGISDLPRLSKVLAQRRHFELLPSSSLLAAQEALVSELAPELESLLSRAEAYVEKLERREQGLKAKWELQEGRLGREVEGASGDGVAALAGVGRKTGAAVGREGAEAAGPEGAEGKVLGAREEMKVRQMRHKKERLSYAVERLQMQAQQTERKLRMSMAAQEQRSKTGPGSRGGDDDNNDTDELA